MKFKLLFASKLFNPGYKDPIIVEINSIDDLKKLYDDYGEDLIVSFEDGDIVVYDDYIE